MRIAHLARALAVAWLLAPTLLAADLRTACRQAQQSLDQNNFAAAIAQLERVLPSAHGDDQVLTLLRSAYRGEIKRLLDSNQRPEAERYLSRLRLIEQVDAPAGTRSDLVKVEMPGVARPTQAQTPAPPQHTTPPTPPKAAAQKPTKKVEPPPPSAEEVTVTPAEPAAPIENTVTTAGGKWKRSSKPIERVQPSSTPANTKQTQPIAQTPASPTTPNASNIRVVNVRSSKPAATAPTKPAAAASDVATAAPQIDDSTEPISPEQIAQRSLTYADALFLAQRYAEAGELYAQAHRESPAVLKKANDRWAYCRLAQVVERINGQPKSAAEWTEINREVESILELIPGNQYATSLLKMTGADRSAAAVATRSTAAPAANKAKAPPIVRATEPDRADQDEKGLLAGIAGRIGAATADGSSQRSLWQRFRSGAWQVLETPNFRIHYTDEKLAGPAADIAESTRIELYRTWFGGVPQGNWNPKCNIYIHDSAEAYARLTGQGAASPGHSSTQIDRGRIVARRVDLRRDGPDVLEAILPHEVTHVVMAERFPTRPLPRWADEGMAVLTEPTDKKEAHLRNLADMLKRGRVYSAKQLMTMNDYPPGNMWGMFYAESVSLVEFLVERKGPAEFIDFLSASSNGNYERELKRVYGFNSFEELDREWAQGRAQQFAAANGG